MQTTMSLFTVYRGHNSLALKKEKVIPLLLKYHSLFDLDSSISIILLCDVMPIHPSIIYTGVFLFMAMLVFSLSEKQRRQGHTLDRLPVHRKATPTYVRILFCRRFNMHVFGRNWSTEETCKLHNQELPICEATMLSIFYFHHVRGHRGDGEPWKTPVRILPTQT